MSIVIQILSNLCWRRKYQNLYIEGSTLPSSFIGKDMVELDGKGEPKWNNGQGIGHKVQSACKLAPHCRVI